MRSSHIKQQHTPSNNQKHFTTPLLAWFKLHGRKQLPWQHPKTPYTVWVSEIMLQQTQVKTVIPYFQRFMDTFPTIDALAHCELDTLLALWAGLGYYSRARNLHKSAQIVYKEYQGAFPDQLDTLMQLPGIGESTASAIYALAFGKPAAILDGNVKRILSRYFMVEGPPQLSQTKRQLKAYAIDCLSKVNPSEYTQAIMDLGALLCTPKQPQCEICPLKSTCLAYANQRVLEFPHKAPKKIKPEYQKQFLVIYHTKLKRLYLEKRPEKGIWGGLWSLPEIELNDCPHAYIQQLNDLACNSPHELKAIKHIFTHFKLHLHPKILYVSGPLKLKDNDMPPKQGQWIEISQLDELGFPKPVQAILESWREIAQY